MKDLKPIEEDALSVIPKTPALVISTQDDYVSAGDTLKLVKNKIKQLNEKRMEYTAPLETTKKKLIADFKKITEPLENYVKSLSGLMIDFNVIEQKRLDKKQAKIDAEAQKKMEKNKEEEIEVEVVNDIKSSRGDVAVTTIKKTWTFELLNEENVPREFCSSDSVKIRNAIKSGVREIKGVKIFEESSIISG